jgi:tetratricopeptide (TPR) repeat protein
VSFHVPPSLARLAIEVEGWIDIGCPDRALGRIHALLDSPGARPAGLALRVRAFLEMQRFEDALRDLGELETLPHDTEWHAVTTGWCRRRLGDLPGATRCMERLIAAERSSVIGYYNLACYLALAGERDRALAMLATAIGLDVGMRAHARRERDFDSIRDDPRFDELVPPAE